MSFPPLSGIKLAQGSHIAPTPTYYQLAPNLPGGLVARDITEPPNPPSGRINPALSDYRSTYAYGIVGNGTSDDTSALLNATNECRNQGKKLYHPYGTCLVSGSITDSTNPNYLSFEGSDPSIALIKQAAGFPAVPIIKLGPGSFQTAQIITNPIAQNANVITGIPSTAGWQNGDWIILRQLDGIVFGNSAGPGVYGACNLYGEYAIIKSVDSGSQITLYGETEFAYNANFVDIRKLNNPIGCRIAHLGFFNNAPGSQSTSARAIQVNFFAPQSPGGLLVPGGFGAPEFLDLRFTDMDADSIQMQQGLGARFQGLTFLRSHDLEATNPYCVELSKATMHCLVEGIISSYGRHAFTTGGPSQLNTVHIAAGSAGQTLPQPIINVDTTAGLPASGIVYIGGSVVSYAGTSGGNQLTGCTGGTDTMSLNQQVYQGLEVAQAHHTVSHGKAMNHSQAAWDTHPGSRKIKFIGCEGHNSYPGTAVFQLRGPDMEIIGGEATAADIGIWATFGADRLHVVGAKIRGCPIGIQLQDSDDCYIGGDTTIEQAATNGIYFHLHDAGWPPGTPQRLTIDNTKIRGTPASGCIQFFAGIWQSPGFKIGAGVRMPDAPSNLQIVGMTDLPTIGSASAAASTLTDVGQRATNVLWERFSRDKMTSAAITAPASGVINAFRMWLPAGLVISRIGFISGSTPANTPLNQWFGIWNTSTLANLALTADDGATAWPANTPKDLAIQGGTFTVPSSGLYIIGFCVVATTVPTLNGSTGTANGQSPVLNNTTTNSGQTVPNAVTLTGLSERNGAPFIYFK